MTEQATITHEPFVADFTGQLSVYLSPSTGMRYTFKKPNPRIQKNRAYMMRIDRATNQITLLLVVT
jgi:hypothetical protein